MYAIRANNNTEKKIYSLPNAPLGNHIIDTEGGIDNAFDPEDNADLHANRHEDYDSAESFAVSHDIRKADGTLEPVPAEILEDSEDSVRTIEAAMHDNNPQEAPDGVGGVRSTPDSINDKEKSRHDCVSTDDKIGKEDIGGTHDRKGIIGSRRRINHSNDTLSSNDRNGIPMHVTSHNPIGSEWPRESGVGVGEKGEAIVEDVSVIPLEEDPEKKLSDNEFEDRMKFGWSECACDKGSASKDSREGKIPRNIEGKDEELEVEKLAQWEQEVFKEDIGKTPDDYHRRADIFELSGEAFLAEKKREEAKSHTETIKKTHVEDTNVDM